MRTFLSKLGWLLGGLSITGIFYMGSMFSALVNEETAFLWFMAGTYAGVVCVTYLFLALVWSLLPFRMTRKERNDVR